MTKKVLVTGGAGYIGSATVIKLLAAGYSVTVLDNLSTGHLAAVPEGVTLLQHDLSDRDKLAELLVGDFDSIVHFAASIEAGESMKEPAKYFHNNVANTAGLLEAAAKSGVKNFVFSSTAAVYAGKDGPLAETDPLGPVNFYGQTKLMIEDLLRWYHKLHGLNICIFRYFNAAGALLDSPDGIIRGENHQPETHLIPLVLQVALGQRDQISIFGDDYPTPDGTNVRDYIHIADLAAAHVLGLSALEQNKFQNEVFNLGNQTGYSNKEVIETARQITGLPIEASIAPRRLGDAPSLVANSEKAKRVLGWQPKQPKLETIIASAWRWHQSHPQGYASIAARAANL
jgi:UDP-glucose 4-epimerase